MVKRQLPGNKLSLSVSVSSNAEVGCQPYYSRVSNHRTRRLEHHRHCFTFCLLGFTEHLQIPTDDPLGLLIFRMHFFFGGLPLQFLSRSLLRGEETA